MATNSKPNSYDHDLTRDQIIKRFRDRITQDKRTKLYKLELEQLILYFVERLQPLKSAALIRALCEAEIALLEEGYPKSTLASDYIPKYRKAIESAIAEGKIPTSKNNSHRYIHTQRVTGLEQERFEHYALTYLKYDKDVYESLARRSADTNQKRQTSLRKVEPNSYLLKLGDLLDAQDKFAARLQALAIAGLTGRRIGEVLARGQFQLSTHPHLLRFEGHQKTTVAAYDIVTLIPAEQLLEYIQQFRGLDEIRSLLELSGETQGIAINQLDVQINRECVKHLSGIVPPLSARSSLSIHNLRSLYGAIAVWLFCPNNTHEYPFIQHYLGHSVDSNATGHYFRYQLVDKAGHPLRDKGVKLSDVGELPLFYDRAAATPGADTQNQIPAADTPDPISPTHSAPVDTVAATPTSDTLGQPQTPPVPSAPVEEAAAQPALPDAVNSPAKSDTNSLDQITADSITLPVTQTPATEKDTHAAVATPPNVPSSATSDTDSLVVTLTYYQRDRHRLSQLLDTLSPTAGTEQQKMAALLDWAEQQLHSADNSGGESQGEDFQPDATDALAPAPASSPDLTPTASTPTPESSSTPTPTSISPLELLITQAVTDQARTLGVMASRVETLEAQVSQLQLERDRALEQLAIAQSVPTDLTQQLDSLQAENTHLRSELDRFEAIRRAFLGESSQPTPSTPASAPALTINEADTTPPPASVPTRAADSTPPAPVPAKSPTDCASNRKSVKSSVSSTPTPTSSLSPVKSTPGNRPRRKGQAKARAENIFHALVAWNGQHPKDTFAMTPWLLEGVFKVNRKAAKQFCLEFDDAIEQHHTQIGIDNVRSHNSGRDTSAVKAFVSNFTDRA